MVCIDDPEAARQALSAVRELAPTVPVLVRTREDTHLDELMAAGATEVVPETLESSFMILSHVLALLGRPRQESEQVLEAVRGERYQLLHGVITGSDEEGRYEEIVRPVLLPARARAIGETLTALEERLGPVAVRGVRRQEVTLDPDSAGALRADDIVILVGAPDAVELGETVLLGG
ncbi:MAG: hypothetical protein U5R48_06170 [Gammaproteobacteria bacterium]|nr:hypothetical protein [Gammaproteobacteria bacterium]